MSLSLPQLPGPAYWNRLFGIGDFGAFQGEALSCLEDVPALNPHWLTTAALLGAYEDPVSVLGAYIASRLTAASQGGPSLLQIAFGQNSPLNDPTLEGNHAVTTLIIPNAFQVSINALAAGRNITNVIGVTNSTGTAAAAAAAVKTAWEISGGPLSQLTANYTMVGYTAVDLSSSHGSIATVTSTAAGGVSSSNQFATRGACALVQWNGSVRSRSTRGRMYYGPLMEASVNADGATLVSGTLSAFTAAFSSFRTSLNSSGYPLSVLSRKDSAAYSVTSHAVETTIATQRRRIRS